MNEFDLIVGTHSIAEAIKNPKRFDKYLVLTEEGLDELKKKTGLTKLDLQKVKTEMVASHKLQEEAKVHYRKLDLEYQRVPSQCFLIASPLELKEVNWLYEQAVTRDQFRILVLDQISDVNNAAAIMRTASFYGIDAIVMPGKKSFGMTPSFFRIASGATEFIEVVPVNNLAKTISKLIEIGVDVIALSEHASENFAIETNHKKHCLVLGKEDTGISNAVLRVIPKRMSLSSQGNIKSLNVSVAASVAMEKCFGIL